MCLCFYTGIIAALSSLDLGIKWLIDREKPRISRSRCRIQRENPAVPESQRRFSFGFLEQHAELVRMLPAAVISGLAGFLAAILPQKGKTVQKFRHCCYSWRRGQQSL